MANHKASPDHFFKAFDHCVAAGLSRSQAMIMAKGYSKRGLIDAAEGCTHYVLMLMSREASND